MKRAFIIMFVSILLGCQGGSITSNKRSLPLVRILTVEQGRLPKVISASGKVQAAQQATVASNKSGRVSTITAKVGEKVEANEPLIWISDPLAESRLNGLRANVESAQASLRSAELTTDQSADRKASDIEQAVSSVKLAEVAVDKAKTVLESAEGELKRKQDLLKKKAIAETDVEKARLNRDESQSDLKTAKLQLQGEKEKLARARGDLSVSVQATQIDQARAALEKARADLASAQTQQSEQVIRAPITGVVVESNVQLGQDPSVSSKPLMVIDDQTALSVVAKFDEKYAAELKPGLEAVGHAVAEVKEEIPLVVERIVPESQGSLISVYFAARDKVLPKIPSESYVRVQLTLNDDLGALIPISSVIWEDGGVPGVVVVEQRKVTRKKITILQKSASQALVPSEELPVGTLLIIEGGASLAEGQEVRTER